jgi:hypothetical protein
MNIEDALGKGIDELVVEFRRYFSMHPDEIYMCQDRCESPQNDQVENPQNKRSNDGRRLLLCYGRREVRQVREHTGLALLAQAITLTTNIDGGRGVK